MRESYMTKDELLHALTKKDGRCFLGVNDRKYLPDFISLTNHIPDDYNNRDRIQILIEDPIVLPKCKICSAHVHWNPNSKGWSVYCSRDCMTKDTQFIVDRGKKSQSSTKRDIQVTLNRDELLHALTKKDGRCFLGVNDRKYTSSLLHLTSHLSDEYTLKERLEILILGHEPRCETCGGLVRWDESSTRWKRFCSIKCCNANEDLNRQKVSKKDYVEIHRKVISTTLNRYGVSYAMQVPEVVEKVRLSCGGLMGGANPETRRKMEMTCIERYGQKTPKMSRTSRPHRMLSEWLDSIGVYHENNTQAVLGDSELDIFIPEKKFAIEVNGVYWHQESKRDKMYHEKKFQKAHAEEINLIQFWDYEVLDSFDLVTSMIRSHLGLNERIYARKCVVSSLNPKDTYDWLQLNHIQGGIRKQSSCLIYDGNIVCVMVICNGVLERFASQRGITVVGGMSKLLHSCNLKNVITYSDNRYSDGKAYRRLRVSVHQRVNWTEILLH